jgi:exoribonuclease R
VHCPIFSELEQLSARALTTTTYLPEGVFFMLPHRIIEAATLRPDRPCRTFNVNFCVDPDTGELHDYSIDVGWCSALRRVTYDAAQEILAANADAPCAGSPAWMNRDDVRVLRRIHEIAVLRYKMRERRNRGFSGSTPDPLIVVEGTDVVDVRDQIICTKDARLAVAELMIAANEVCSRVAQAAKVSVPFRGSRPLSSFQEAAAGRELVPPLGYAPLPSQDAGVAFFARTLIADLERLRGVTRAYYSHFPVYHNGLDTRDYCHSTSPLRRYPDMLVHHQLKANLARDRGAPLLDVIPQAFMEHLCAYCSSVQSAGKFMQLKTDRFWILRFLEKKLAADPLLKLRCYVGATEFIQACPEIAQPPGSRAPARFRSDVYVPEVQMVHAVYHDREDMLVGVTAVCRIAAIDAYLDRLALEVVQVTYEADVQRALSQMVVLLADA